MKDKFEIDPSKTASNLVEEVDSEDIGEPIARDITPPIRKEIPKEGEYFTAEDDGPKTHDIDPPEAPTRE